MKKLFTFFCAIIISNSLFAQIPNPSFETWDTSAGYKTPVGWDNPDSATNALSIYPCQQGTPGVVGSYYLKLTSKTVITTVVPGVAVSGKIDFTTLQPKSGFAYTSRPADLTGSWQYMASGSDQGHIVVLLTKWNTVTSSHDTVAFVDHPLSGMVMSWGTFSIPLTYQSASTPDTALILLSASGTTPVAGSYLYVDNLAFTGTVTGITNVSNETGLSIYPNPATDAATITYNSASGSDIKICINDMNGRSIVTMTPSVIIGENKFVVNVSTFAKGIYFIKIIEGKDTRVQKLVIE